MGKRTRKQIKKSREENAKERTAQAAKNIQEIESLLAYTLHVNDAIDWDVLKYKDQFSTVQKNIPEKEDFLTKIGFFEGLFGKEKKRAKQQEEFDKALSEYHHAERLRKEFEEEQSRHNEGIDKFKEKYQKKLS